jgi:hypothetical protein
MFPAIANAPGTAIEVRKSRLASSETEALCYPSHVYVKELVFYGPRQLG